MIVDIVVPSTYYIKNWDILRITFIHEDSSEVTKYGQTQAIINQLLTGVQEI